MVTAPPQWSSVVEDIGRPFVVTPTVQAVTCPASNPLPAILFAVWLCGFAVSIVAWFRCWRQMQTARRGAIPYALRLPIPVMSSSSRLEPGVFGIRKPVLLLPEGIENRLTSAQLHMVLAHEMCHVRRPDNLTAAIHMIVEAVFWFYPLVWWIRARLVEERERACDEAVVQSGSDPEAYAEGILSVCKFYVESPFSCVSGISGSDLKKRIIRIMTERVARKLDLRRKLLLGGVGVLTVAVPVAFGLLHAPPGRAQSQAEDAASRPPTFEVASIRPHEHGFWPTFSYERFTPEGFIAKNTIIQSIIVRAYDLRDPTLTVRARLIPGGQKWMLSDWYDIQAKMSDSDIARLSKLSDEERDAVQKRMLQSLLADRCKLKVHREIVEAPAYTLVLAKTARRT